MSSSDRTYAGAPDARFGLLGRFSKGGRIAELGKLGSKEALSWLFTVLTLSLPGSIFLLFFFSEENKLINKCGETLVPLLSGSGVTARCSRYRVSRVPKS